MITVGYGDILPTSDLEMIISVIIMLISCGFFAYAINSIGLIVQDMYRAENDIDRNLYIVTNFMHNKAI